MSPMAVSEKKEGLTFSTKIPWFYPSNFILYLIIKIIYYSIFNLLLFDFLFL